jgi:hypothetical protein
MTNPSKEERASAVNLPLLTLDELEDLPWAIERATNMCASALIDAQVYRQKLLKGFGYPNETFSRAQDHRALLIILSALQAVRAEGIRPSRVRMNEMAGQLDSIYWMIPPSLRTSANIGRHTVRTMADELREYAAEGIREKEAQDLQGGR